MKKKLIKKYSEELSKHPAVIFANQAITLQAIRSGTNGYQGEENLGHFIEKVVNEVYDTVEAHTRIKIFELLHKKFMTVKDTKIMDLLEELQKEILNELGKEKD